MKTFIRFSVLYLFLGSLLVSCGLPVVGGNGDLEGTQVAIAIQQTSLAMQQEQLEQPAPVQEETQIDVLPTYTPYPTYTVQVSDTQVVIQPTATSEPVQVEEPAPVTSFEDWMEDVKILLYDDMYGYGEALVIENALDGLG
ncbi:MAG: hypothetical protein SVP52_04535, partial [Chloroflexota bacterium]|nr:hypothetical protein [Chloroflexota bacterium]